MSGNEIYENKIIERIENRIINNKDITCLRGYVNSISLSRSYSSVYAYLGVVINFFRYVDKIPRDLCYDDYLNYLSSIRRLTSSHQIVSYSALRKLSQYLFASGQSDMNYMETIETPKSIEKKETKEKRDKNYLNSEELVQYINNVKNCIGNNKRECTIREHWNERDLAIIMLLLCTGMRCSALYKLNVSDINLDQCSLITIDKEQKVEEHFYSKEVRDTLQIWIDKRNKLMEGKDDDALFISKDLSRMSQHGISEITKKYSANINGKVISPHKLRATYGTLIYENTHDLYIVQQCMGHANPSTSELYIRGQKNVGRQEAANIMTDLLY